MNVSASSRTEVDILRRQLERAKAENVILATMIEDRTRSLFLAHRELQVGKQHLENVLTSLSAAVLTTDGDGRIVTVGGRTVELAGRSEEELIGLPITTILRKVHGSAPLPGVGTELGPGATMEGQLVGTDRVTPVLVTCSRLAPTPGLELGDPADGGPARRASDGAPEAAVEGREGGRVYTAIDITERKQLEIELRHAQQLESVGSVAAGVAHEINTPIQYVIDSVRFLADAVDDLFEMDRHREEAGVLLAEDPPGRELAALMERKAEELDLAYTKAELPDAVERALSGLMRVSSIVKAMRGFSHLGDEITDADLNQVADTALTLARHEYKYVADVEVRPGTLPTIRCNKVQLTQVLVNLLVNSAQAIEDRHAGTGGRGHIRVTTEVDGDGVRIDVSDDGGGIPESVRNRIFEPFFTTKAPGRGTGQGLALAWRIVVEGHGGRLTVDVDDGVGTTFHIWLPREVGQ